MSSSMTLSDQITEYYEPLSTSCVKIKRRCEEARLERDQTEDQRLEARGFVPRSDQGPLTVQLCFRSIYACSCAFEVYMPQASFIVIGHFPLQLLVPQQAFKNLT